MITLGAIGVLAVIAVIVVIGVITSMILPPRGTAVVVGERSYTTGELSERTITALRMQMLSATTMAGVIDEGTELLIRQELLRQVGGPTVGIPDEAAIETAIRERLQVAPEAPREDYVAALQDHLSTQNLSRSRYEQMITADVMAERMRDHLGEDLPATGPQVNLLVASSVDRMALEALRERVLAGEDFAEVAVELGFAEAATVDAGWLALDALAEEVQAAIEGLEPGQPSESVVPPQSLDAVVYFVADRDPEREYDEQMLDQLKALLINDFFEEQREAMNVEIQLSQGERDWIANQIEDALS
jgi:hypothetical protein